MIGMAIFTSRVKTSAPIPNTPIAMANSIHVRKYS